VNIPGRVGHDHRELAQHRQVQVANVAVYPLRGRHSRLCPGAGDFNVVNVGFALLGFVFDLVVYIFARIVVEAVVQKRAVTQMFLRVWFDNLFKVQLVTIGHWAAAARLKVAKFLDRVITFEFLRERNLLDRRRPEQLVNLFEVAFGLELLGALGV